MEVEEYALTVLAYKNSIIRICWLMEAVGLIGMIAVGIFVYRGLKIKSIGFGRDKASLACCIMVVLTLFMLFTAIFTAMMFRNANRILKIHHMRYMLEKYLIPLAM